MDSAFCPYGASESIRLESGVYSSFLNPCVLLDTLTTSQWDGRALQTSSPPFQEAIAISREELIQVLLEDIRKCPPCPEVEGKRTPVVYSAKDPKVLIVSEVPPLGAWKKGLGDAWRTALGIPEGTRYTSATLLKWLSTEDRQMTGKDAEALFFWIQRANCCLAKKTPKKAKHRVYNYCSSKWIAKAIDVVKPRMIISLGRYAAWWFNPGKMLTDLVGNDDYIKYKDYDYFALAHSSPASPWPSTHPEKHRQSLNLVRPIIAELLQEL